MSTEHASTTGVDETCLESNPPRGVKHTESNIVDWDGTNNPANPLNWPSRKRWAHLIVVSLLALVTNMGPTMCAPGISLLASEFNITSQALSTLAMTIYLLGLAIGPMFMSPLSEIYGRVPIYHAASLGFVAFVVGNAVSSNISQFMVFRFLSGCTGGTPMALGGGTIADITRIERRGVAMALFSLGPLTGPVLGPVIGGFVVADKGWRWTFWILAILGSTFGLAALIIMSETHPKILLKRKAAHLRISTGNEELVSKLAYRLTPRQVIAQALVRPILLLTCSPVLLVMSLYVAFVFGLMYLLFTTFTSVFEGQYRFSTSVSGLVYLGLGVALILAMFIFGALSDRVQKAWMEAEGIQRPRPEYRLILMIFFSPCVGIGLFIYGWTAYYKVHWIIPIIGTSIIGLGAFFILVSSGPSNAEVSPLEKHRADIIDAKQLYLVDLFGSEAAASALGANNLLRFLSSTFLPLAGSKLYRTLNYGWGNTLLGLLALCFVPAPVLFYKYGERLRMKGNVTA